MSATGIRTEIQTALEQERARTVEIDAAEAFSKFSQTQFSLEASIAQAQICRASAAALFLKRRVTFSKSFLLTS